MVSEISNNIIIKAILQSSKVINSKYKHGCVIFDGNEVLSVGYNKKINIPSLKREGFYVMLHAELDCLLRLHKERKNMSLLVIRQGINKLQNSKPCLNCMSAIISKGIRSIYYSNKEGGIDKIGLK